MKDDLKRLLNEFLSETHKYRQEERDLQFSSDMPKKTEKYTRKPDLEDLINWLNGKIGEDY